LNKRELAERVAESTGSTKHLAIQAVETVFDEIQDAIARGEKVSIAGFGIFDRHNRPARTARNPATGATVQVPPTVIPKFRPGAGFRANVSEKSQS